MDPMTRGMLDLVTKKKPRRDRGGITISDRCRLFAYEGEGSGRGGGRSGGEDG